MIDLTTEDDLIPARTPINAFSKSNLKEDIPVASVQPAPTGKQTQKVKVEISSPHHLPTKDRDTHRPSVSFASPHHLPTKGRDTHRPSVSFASPVESQRYQWTDTSTAVRKQRPDLGVFKT
jgi:hypothetical protein